MTEGVVIGILALLGVAAFLWNRRADRRRRLMQRLPVEGAPVEVAVSIETPFLERYTIPYIQAAVRRSGVAATAFDVILLSLTMGLTGTLAADSLFHLPFVTVVAGLAGAYVPFLILGIVAGFRMRKLEAQLADAIDLMVAALQAGISVRHSIELVRTEKKGPIQEEFRELVSLIDLGVPGPIAFRVWAKPLKSKIIEAFSIAMASKWDVGGNYSDMLKNLADRIRESIRLRRRVATLTAEAKITAFFALVLPYVLAGFLYSVNNDHFGPLVKHPAGLTVLYVCISLQIMAIMIIRRMIRTTG